MPSTVLEIPLRFNSPADKPTPSKSVHVEKESHFADKRLRPEKLIFNLRISMILFEVSQWRTPMKRESQSTFCDGLTRRSFVSAGVLSFGSLSLSELLRTRAMAATQGQSLRPTSVIFLEQAGGPTHFETYDPKPEAPIEYRGPLGTVQSALPGIQLSELMVEQAKVLDRMAVIRSVHHSSNSHDTSSHLTQTGYYKKSRKGGANTFPCVGSVTARLIGSRREGLPAYVAVPSAMRNGKSAFAGPGYDPFETGSDPNRKDFRVNNLGLVNNLTINRLKDRRGLKTAFEAKRRMIDQHGVGDAIDDYSRQAFDLVAGGVARDAFDMEKENDATRNRYGRNTVGQSLLLARRLVEAGVTFVTTRVTGWDDHSKIADRMRQKGPNFDRGVAALISDLNDRGMQEDVLVVAMGEFGRTPRINKGAGRDHWGSVMSVMLSGGAYRMGQIIGSSNRNGEVPAESPYRPENVLSMVYRHLGLGPDMTILDHDGRPRYLLEDRAPIKELL